MTSYQVAVAAEAFAACVLAQAECDVSIQYGANQPGHDLVATKGNRAIKVSVKGSQDGGWGLVQSHKEGRNYHECAEHWLTLQQSETVFCLVQFQGVKTGECPRAYFVRPSEIVQQLKVSRSGHGSTILYERYSYKKGLGAGTEDKLPDSWRATSNRIQDFFF